MKYFRGTTYTDFSLVLINLNMIGRVEEIEKGSKIVFKESNKQPLLVRDPKHYLEWAKENIEYCDNLYLCSSS